MPKKTKEEIEEIEEKEIEEIVEEMEKEAVEEKKRRKKEEKEEKKEEIKEPEKEKTALVMPSGFHGLSTPLEEEMKKKREKKEPIIRDDLSEIENRIINIIGYEPRRPRAITRMLRGKLNQNEVVSILRQLEEKKVVKREGTKSWRLA
jgi:Fe-S cluster assembly scaffold protein SufB